VHVQWYILIEYVKDVLSYPYPYDICCWPGENNHLQKNKFIMLYETGKDEMCNMPLPYDI